MTELYFVPSQRKIHDDKGNVYTPEEAAEYVAEHGPVACNIAFVRLMEHNYDVEAANRSYDG